MAYSLHSLSPVHWGRFSIYVSFHIFSTTASVLTLAQPSSGPPASFSCRVLGLGTNFHPPARLIPDSSWLTALCKYLLLTETVLWDSGQPGPQFFSHWRSDLWIQTWPLAGSWSHGQPRHDGCVCRWRGHHSLCDCSQAVWHLGANFLIWR